MIEVITDFNQKYRDDIRLLYVNTFSNGDNAQWIDSNQLEESLNNTYQSGFMIVGLLSGKPVAALFVVSLKFDNYCPVDIKRNFKPEKTPYISELMVDDGFRGRGFGKIILEKSVDMLKQKAFTDVFIRVWERNKKALQLYRNAGFEPVAEIFQLKKLPDGVSTLEMRKVYLHRQL